MFADLWSACGSARRSGWMSNGRLACMVLLVCTVLIGAAAPTGLRAAELAQTIVAVKPAVVGIATSQKLRSPGIVFFGTGFVVADGLTIVTNAHVVVPQMDVEKSGTLGILVGTARSPEFRPARVLSLDREHDLAILRVEGTPMPALKLGDSADVPEGQSLAFTGFPLGMALGFYHSTHRAMVSAITPILQPAITSRGLDAKAVTQLKKSAYGVFQLDGTAYPGNSGSPLYDPATGIVYGIVNMVFVKSMKETAISNPSGISYAIPSNYIRELLATQKN